MIKIGTIELQQTKGGLSIEYEDVRCDDWGMDQQGRYDGTCLGKRVYIAIQLNQITKEKARAIANATSNANGFYITFHDIFTNAERSDLLFVVDGRTTWNFANQKRGIVNSPAFVFMSKEVI